jgi:predicted RNase H-like HicB family nuclease
MPDLRRIPQWLGVDAVRLAVGDATLSLRLDGLVAYASYNPASEADRCFRTWASNFLDRVPSVNVVCKERKPRYAPRCQACHQTITECPHCGATTAGTVEKGVDVAIATDMIRLAWEESYDYAVLVSSDADHVPAVEFLNSKGRRVIHVGFPPSGMNLAKACWASLDMSPHVLNLESWMYKYEVVIYWSKEDQAFLAEVPELPGCLPHGETAQEALVRAQIAMVLWIDTAREFGDPVPEPKGRLLLA